MEKNSFPQRRFRWAAIALLLTCSCASSTFHSFKQQLVSHTDEVVVTFYDSAIMNAQTLKKLTEFSVDNSEEVNRFRRFIRRLRAKQKDCRGDGSLTFYNEKQQLQRMEFNLQNRCVTVHPPAPVSSEELSKAVSDDSASQHRLSRKGAEYLETLRNSTTENDSENDHAD